MQKRPPTLLRPFLLLIVCLAASSQAQAQSSLLGGPKVPGLFNTGVDNSGAVPAVGSPEVHYVMTGPISQAFVITRRANWVVAPPGSAWIGPTNGSVPDPVGLYIYTLSFDLTGYCPNTAIAVKRP